MKIYIATGFERAQEADVLASLLEVHGFSVTYPWFRQSYDDLFVDEMHEICRSEINGVKDACAVVAWLPGGRGTHTEIGIALGAGVPVMLLRKGDETLTEPPFYLACRQTSKVGDVIAWLSVLSKTGKQSPSKGKE